MKPQSGEEGDLEAEIAEILATELTLPRLSPDADLIGGGYLDSLALVDLVFHLEQRFGFEVGLDDLEARNFSSINHIADFVRKHSA